MTTDARPRMRQEERSRLMRRRLLEATVDCLVEHGFAGTTTKLIAERAGVSRGAQLHHFGSRGVLVAAAVEYMYEVRADELRRHHPGRRDTEEVLKLIAGFHMGSFFSAALELWVAARTDAELRAAVVPLEARIGRATHRLAIDLLGADETRPGVREAVQATLDLMRGLALAGQLTDDSARRGPILRQWAAMLDGVLK